MVREHLAAEDGGYVCLVNIKDYYDFITDASGKRSQTIFDANVRDYEGSVEVNKAIRETLKSPQRDMDFWWLNNGITIIASKARMNGKKIVLEDPKVVNGLQTSQEIWRYFSNNPNIKDSRLILIRIITIQDDTVQNNIIRATNSQSKIPAYSLRATDVIHQYIEQDFKLKDLFYDRQKNFYKNQGKPRKRIISIQYLSQAVASIILQRPNDARGRPTNLIKKDSDYKQIFNEKYPLKLYLKSAKLMMAVDNYLSSEAPEEIRKEKTNLRYHLVMYASCLLIGRPKFKPEELANISIDKFDEILKESAPRVHYIFESLKSEKKIDGDLVAKNRDYDNAVLNEVERQLQH